MPPPGRSFASNQHLGRAPVRRAGLHLKAVPSASAAARLGWQLRGRVDPRKKSEIAASTYDDIQSKSTSASPPGNKDCRGEGSPTSVMTRRSSLLGAAGVALAGPISLGSPATAEDSARAFAADVRGRVAMVTGASSGIGFSAAVGLLKMGYTVVPAARSVSRTKDTADRLLSEVPGGRVECLDEPCDLSSIGSVEAFSSAYLQSGLPLDSLLECAGIAWCDELKSADGIELQFATNHLGHFHLANSLMPLLREGRPGGGPPPHLVVMTSSAHYAGSCSPSALVGAAPAHPYNRWLNYCDSKLCNVLHAREVARREEARGSPVIATSVHPGIVNTNLIRYIAPEKVMQARQKDLEGSLRIGKMLGLLTPDEGALGTIWLANAGPGEEVGGGYYQGMAPPVLTEPLAAAGDPELAAGLWAASEVLVAKSLGRPVPKEAYELATRPMKTSSTATALLPGFVRMQMTNGAG